MPENDPDLSPIADVIIAGVSNWFLLKHGLDLEDLEDCSAEIADNLLERGFIKVDNL